jgi:hypothetical protein
VIARPQTIEGSDSHREMSPPREPMTKSALLKGRSIGNPFLLAWILGMSVAYALIVLVCAAGVTSTNGGIVSLGVTACILGLSLCCRPGGAASAGC